MADKRVTPEATNACNVFPYSLYSYIYFLQSKVDGYLTELRGGTTTDLVQVIHGLIKRLSGGFTDVPTFSFEDNGLIKAHSVPAGDVTLLYACGLSTALAEKTLPICHSTAILIRQKMKLEVYPHLRGKGNSPLLKKIDAQKGARMMLLINLCAHVRANTPADGLQAIVSGTLNYFYVCQLLHIDPLIDATHLYVLLSAMDQDCADHEMSYRIQKCETCSGLLPVDICKPGATQSQ